jgi:hypothetical protein
MSRDLKFSDKKKLQRIFLQGRNRGVAAAQRRMREEQEQEELDHDSEADYERSARAIFRR